MIGRRKNGVFSTGPFPEGWTTVVAVSTVLIALANCFFGYRLLKLWIAVAGFFCGVFGGFSGHRSHCAPSRHRTDRRPFCLAPSLPSCPSRSICAGCFPLPFNDVQPIFHPSFGGCLVGEYVICLVFAVLVGLISIRFVRPVVIASTALSGGFSAVGTALTAMSP